MIVSATGASAGGASAISSIAFLSNPSEYILIIAETRIVYVSPQNQLIFRRAE